MASTSASSSPPERLEDLQSKIHSLEAQLATLKLEASSISNTSTLPRKEETGRPLELEEYVSRTTLLPSSSSSTRLTKIICFSLVFQTRYGRQMILPGMGLPGRLPFVYVGKRAQ